MPKYTFTDFDDKAIVMPREICVVDEKDSANTRLIFKFNDAAQAQEFLSNGRLYVDRGVVDSIHPQDHKGVFSDEHFAFVTKDNATDKTAVSVKKINVKDKYGQALIAYCEKQKNKSLLIKDKDHEEGITSLVMFCRANNLSDALLRLPIEQHKSFLKAALDNSIFITNHLKAVLDQYFPALQSSLAARQDHKGGDAKAAAAGAAQRVPGKFICFWGEGSRHEYAKPLCEPGSINLVTMGLDAVTFNKVTYQINLGSRMHEQGLLNIIGGAKNEVAIVFCPASADELSRYARLIASATRPIGAVVILDSEILGDDNTVEDFKAMAQAAGLLVIDKPTAINRESTFRWIEFAIKYAGKLSAEAVAAEVRAATKPPQYAVSAKVAAGARAAAAAFANNKVDNKVDAKAAAKINEPQVVVVNPAAPAATNPDYAEPPVYIAAAAAAAAAIRPVAPSAAQVLAQSQAQVNSTAIVLGKIAASSVVIQGVQVEGQADEQGQQEGQQNEAVAPGGQGVSVVQQIEGQQEGVVAEENAEQQEDVVAPGGPAVAAQAPRLIEAPAPQQLAGLAAAAVPAQSVKSLAPPRKLVLG